MSKKNEKLNVVLLCYQEAENLKVLLPKIQTVLSQSNWAYEIIIIDTHKPKDDTAAICAQHKANYFNREPSDLYGDAFRTALKKINGTKALFMDADGSHPPEFILTMLNQVSIDPTVDLVIASRYVSGGNTENQPLLVLMSKFLNFLYSKALGFNCKDVSNSFRLYNTLILKDLVLKCNHFDILEELLFQISAKNKTCKIIELPFEFKKRLYGESKRKMLVFISSYFKTLVKLFFMKHYYK